MTMYKDFRKGVKEVLEAGHAGGEQKVEIETRSALDTVIKTDISRKSTDAPLKASLKAENKIMDAHLIEASVDSDGKLSTLLNIKGLYTGLLVSVGGSTVLSVPKKNDQVETKIEYRHAMGTVSTVVACPLNKEGEDARVSTLTTSGSVFHKETGLNLGGEVLANLASKQVTDYSAGVLYKAAAHTLGATIKEAGKAIAANFRYDATTLPVSVAAEFGHAFPKTTVDKETNEEVTVAAKNTYVIGALYRPNNLSSIRARINQDGWLASLTPRPSALVSL
eukprot:TRINITY_DN313_c0_g1_i1.p1 TRINITY_DN313_c0_g1~~TRINITY_DN313_c0_g1_i1.p1  ORF type:complete len:279 (+),score=159.97 TRINITY_DN313_c0_g1_i1:58-894(+)